LLNGVSADDYTAVKPAAISGQEFEGYGLDWLAAFDAYFVTQMADWIKASATGPAIFWNFGDGTLPLDIPNYTNADTPDATAAFKAAFSTG
jgi:hypothetical protein